MKSAALSATQTASDKSQTVSKAHLEEHINSLLHSTSDNRVELHTLPDQIPYRIAQPKEPEKERMVQTVI